jgi:hypothetical protein
MGPEESLQPWLGGLHLLIFRPPSHVLVHYRLCTYRRDSLIRVQVALSDEDRLRPTNL